MLTVTYFSVIFPFVGAPWCSVQGRVGSAARPACFLDTPWAFDSVVPPIIIGLCDGLTRSDRGLATTPTAPRLCHYALWIWYTCQSKFEQVIVWFALAWLQGNYIPVLQYFEAYRVTSGSGSLCGGGVIFTIIKISVVIGSFVVLTMIRRAWTKLHKVVNHMWCIQYLQRSWWPWLIQFEKVDNVLMNVQW